MDVCKGLVSERAAKLNEAEFQKIKQAFAAVLDAPEEKRAAILRQNCGEDSVLLEEVRSLLAAHDEAENIIEKNVFSFDSPPVENNRNYAGKQFGRYKIIKEIGRGGMGAVFLAERCDGEFNQKVALKIVRQTIVDAETEKRFRREREILASLNHPNIAQLHDGGVSEEGEAFLAMEVVEGENLLEFAAKKNLSVEEKLNLFLKICAAVSYAHQNLTIHRDLKPSNILVTDAGEPKLLDFGLAKILDENLSDQNQTATIFRAFTPAYASPEQILGNTVTTVSDVYSLGVVFYELLAGDKPFHFEGKSLEEIIRTVTNAEPPAPSVIQNSKTEIQNPKLRGDIDNIALKALQREPERRYKSVEEFAGDIQKHLDGLPILARSATFSYRASKFFRRNKISAAAAAIVILSVITGLAFTLRQANETAKERDRAEKRFNDVRKLSNSLLFEITPKIENLNGSTEAREILVKRALEYLDSLAHESQNDVQLQSELASAYEKVGDLQGNPSKPNLSDFTGAIASYEKANQIRQNLPKSVENSKLLAKNFLRLSAAHYTQNDVKGSIEDSDESLKIYKNLLANTDSFELKIDYIEARIDNAQIYSDNNQYKTAIPLFQKTLESIAEADNQAKEIQRLTVKADTFFANALSWEGRQTEAEAEIMKTSEIAEKLLADYPNDSGIRQQIWRTFFISSSIYEEVNNRISLDFAEKALKLAQFAVADDGADTQAKQNLAKSFSKAGICSVLNNQLFEALGYFRKSEEIIRELVDKEPKNLAYQKDFGRLYIRLGDFYRKQKDFPRALENYEKSVFYFEKVENSDETNTLVKRDAAQSMKNVGEIQSLLNQKAEARQTFEKTLNILNVLDSQNALGEFDRKLIVDVQTSIQKL
jgi:serine/threonine protein kinase